MAWSNTQGNAAQSAATIASLAFTTQNNAVNSLLICALAYTIPATNGSGDVSLSDSKSNSWSKAYSHWTVYGSHTIYIGLFYAVNTQGTGGEKITINISGYFSGAVYVDAAIEEFTGNATSSPQDGSGNSILQTYASGTQTLNGPALTTAGDGDLIYVFFYDNQWYVTAFTSLGIYTVSQALYNGSTRAPVGDEWGVQTTHGAITPTFKITTSGTDGLSYDSYMAAAAFKAAGGASANYLTERYWESYPYQQ